MASPQNRGLPTGFGLNVPSTATQKPVDIGDYLDDDTPAVPAVAVQKRTSPKPVVAQPVIRETPQPPVTARATPKARPPVVAEPIEEEGVEEQTPSVHTSRKTPPRKQINMKPDTLRKAEELVRHVQTFSVQKDTAASEVFDALVELLHDAKKHMDVSSVPPRGQWGKPTARGFRTSLKNAFAQAIVELQQAKEQS